MAILLGIACVAWTTFELIRLGQAEPRHRAEAKGGLRRAATVRSSYSPRRPRFTAWDDHGRPITVDDLGRR